MFISDKNSPSFNGFFGLKKIIDPEIVRNRYRILLTQDIYSPSLKIKPPENETEKEVLLEVLRKRRDLDRFVELTNERFKRITEGTGPINSYDNEILLEMQKNKDSIDYFKSIEKLEEKYRKEKMIKNSKFNEFWKKIVKYNINKDETIPTKELIDIIENSSIRIFSKKELLKLLPKKYESMLRERINMYAGGVINTSPIREETLKLYEDSIKGLPDIGKQIIKSLNKVEADYMEKVKELHKATGNIHHIDKLWPFMEDLEIALKEILTEIEALKLKAKTSTDKQIKNELKDKEKIAIDMKKTWLKCLKANVKFEQENREIIKKSGKLSEYEYLVDEFKVLKKYQTAYKYYVDNKGKLPQSFWTNIVLKDIQ